ncbi:uncharacterized protein MELLADRAFT_65057 [Melampsora larici-populina 98AG31]|uniref:Alpha-type protein kinase domain-containing protein n=1 Tax=Melampsora larici-populina (strain 98AG31 / pathotype 3-4-7) TaxID=747676 RepID=F4RTU2_MELLP|nr:uncharacterized protein MELLADRAFT_65057 [Melampsora larici-populina 98AG31]EGG04061.1 hypothetical protein MELLADRAFT_65057 [Melampsora larici-populina 98AG31]
MSTPLPMCDTCTEEYPYMDTKTLPTCGACLHDNALDSAEDRSTVPPLNYCKDGCGMTLPAKFHEGMCRPCQRKIQQYQENQQTSHSTKLPVLVDEVDPARLSAIQSSFTLPQLPSRSRNPVMPVPPVAGSSRPNKRPAQNPPPSQTSLLGPDREEAYQHGESAAKKICLDRIQENKKKSRPTAIGRMHKKKIETLIAPALKSVAVKLKYNLQSGSKSHSLPQHMHDIDFTDPDWEIKIMEAAIKHFQKTSLGIFPPTKRDVDRLPALPDFNSSFYSLGVLGTMMSGDRLQQAIISPNRNPRQQSVPGPLVVTLFFAAATYLSFMNPPSSNFGSDSETKDSEPKNDSSQSESTHKIGTPLPDGHPASDGQIITTISWSDALQSQLGIGHQIALFSSFSIRSFGGVLPSVEDLARPLRYSIPWSNAILMALTNSNTRSSLEENSQPLVFGQWGTLAAVEDQFFGEGKRHRSFRTTLYIDGGCRKVVAKEIITEGCGDQAAYLKDSVVYHQTSCLLEDCKLDMFVQYDVTIAQKRILNSLQVVFNMVMIQEDNYYKVEELLDHSPETIPTMIDDTLKAPISLLSDALNAFGHYIYDYFKGQALIFNIKTVNGRLTGMRMVDRRFQWSTSNKLPDEIHTFKLEHLCGECCKVLKLKSADFEYPTSDDRADSGIQAAIDPVLETIEHTRLN